MLFHFQSADGGDGAAFYFKSLGGSGIIPIKHIDKTAFGGRDSDVGSFAVFFGLVLIGDLHNVRGIGCAGDPFEGSVIQVNHTKSVTGSIRAFLIQEDNQGFALS